MPVWNKDEKKKELDLVKQCVKIIIALKKKYKDDVPQEQLETIIETTFPSFIENYYALYRLTLKTDDVSMLDIMIDKIMNICDGDISINEVQTDIGNVLAEKYLYPKLGKPNKKE